MARAAATFSRRSPLAGVAIPGRFGADKGAPGVVLSVMHPLSLVMVIARAGKAKAVKDAVSGLRGVTVMWAGADQYYVQSLSHAEGALEVEMKRKLAGIASVSDQSHGRVTLVVEGPKARNLLAKGTPVDVHADAFSIGSSAVTQMAHVGVHLTRVGQDAFQLSVFRGFSESFWEWLTEQALEFGYQVR